MKQRYANLLILLSLWIIAGCTPVIEPPAPEGEGLNLDKVVVVGSCLAAGMADSEVRQGPGLPATEVPYGGFYAESQQYSFANIVGGSLQSAGAPPFRQPLLSSEGSGHLELLTVTAPRCENAPLNNVYAWKDGASNWANASPGEDFDNLAIPHLMLRDAFKRTSVYANPYQNWMLGNSGTDSTCYCDFVLQKEATFSIISLGIEDLLYFAYNGAGIDNPYPMTDPNTFYNNFDFLLGNLLQIEGSKLAVLNIPDVTQMAFFTTIPLVTYDEATCEEQPVYIERLNGEIGPAQEGERILFSAKHALLTGEGTIDRPLPEKLVLDLDEIADIRKYTKAYNDILTDLTRKLNTQGNIRVSLVDIHGLYEDVYVGTFAAGSELNGDYVRGGFYSLDGLMPTPRGHALIANTIIETIKETFSNVNIPTVSLSNYPIVRVL